MKRMMLAAVAAGILLVPAWAQDPNPGDDGGDAPEHGVARLSLIQGDVSVRHGDQGEMTAGAINAPLVTTDQVMTGENSRAEVQFDSANLIRMAPGAEIRMGDLQYKHYLVQIAAGTVTFSVVRDNDSQVEISTPTVSVRPARRGNYRVTVQPDGMCEITVREGDAEIFGPRGSEDLHAGQTMMARGTPSDPEFQVVATIPRDDWDRWNQDRDRVFEQSASSRYVSPDVYGAESLDPYGRWVYDPAYGYVWVPAEAPGWAPYQDGRWAWEDYYGWSWIGAEPWGWAPYHYGRWYMGSFGWAWWPGAIGPRYYWRPALVGFCGWGGGFGFGFGFGNVGWVPLAPFEPFRPWYGRGFGGFNQTNIVNNVNITNVYRNARVTNAVTSVRSSDFGRGAVNSRNMVRASTGDLARGGQVRGAMPFTPSAQSRHFSDTSVSTRGMPQARANTQFYSRGATQNQSRAAAANGPASGGGFSRGNAPAAGAAQNSSQGNWRRFDPGSSGGGRQAQGGSAGPAAQNRGGSANTTPSQSTPNRGGAWQRFEGNRNPGATQGAAPAPQNRGFSQPSPSFSAPNRGGGSYSPAPQRPVQINPPIVRDRGASGGGGGGYSHPQSHAGNFGGAHPGGGGGGGGNRGGGGGGGHGGGGHR